MKMGIRCNVNICKHNDGEKGCTFSEDITLDYFGMDAMPTCLMFERGEYCYNPDIFDINKD